MMPLVFADADEINIIKKIGGTPEVRKHLESLGFTVGGEVMVICETDGDVIVRVRDSRVAVSRQTAELIMV